MLQACRPYPTAIISGLAGRQGFDAILDEPMSTRAMQRLLKDKGTSFRQVLDEVRNEHARGYLSSTAFSDGEVSFLLGFEDPNSFYRAFRSWNGMSPSEFRRQSAPSVWGAPVAAELQQ